MLSCSMKEELILVLGHESFWLASVLSFTWPNVMFAGLLTTLRGRLTHSCFMMTVVRVLLQ